MAYTDTTTLQKHLNTTFTAQQVDYLTDIVIPAFDAWIDTYIGGSFDNANPEVTVKKDGKDLPAVWNNHLDVTEVKLDDKVVSTNDYVVTENHVVKKEGKFDEGVLNVELTGTKKDVPAEIEAAATYLVGKVLQPQSVTGATEERYMDYTIKYAGSPEKHADDVVKSLLQKYRAIYV